VPTYLTGAPAEGTVKGLPGVSNNYIESHEETATIAFVGVLVVGACALAGLVFSRSGRAVPGWLGYSVLVAVVVGGGLMAWTANLGGQVRHTEIRGAQSASDSARE